MKRLAIVLLGLGISSCATLKLAPLDEYNGDWIGTQRATQKGACTTDSGSLNVRYKLSFSQNGDFTGALYSSTGDLLPNNVFVGTVSPDGSIRMEHQTSATCDYVKEKVVSTGTGKLVQTPSGPVLTLTVQENICSNCKFLVERTLRPAK